MCEKSGRWGSRIIWVGTFCWNWRTEINQSWEEHRGVASMGSGKVKHIWSLELVKEFEEPKKELLLGHWSEKEELRKYTHSQINKTRNGEFLFTIPLPTSLESLSLKAGTGQSKALPFRRRLGLRPPEEPEPTQSHGKWANVSQVPEGIGRCHCWDTLHYIWKLWQSKPSVPGEKRTPCVLLKKDSKEILWFGGAWLEEFEEIFSI